MSAVLVSPTTIRSRILKDPLDVGCAAADCGFTHNDPFEDTESMGINQIMAAPPSFTHNDPFEDTESECGGAGSIRREVGFTHNDPFEDTERFYYLPLHLPRQVVSPTTIRSRILKDNAAHAHARVHRRFHPQRSVRGY